MKVEARTLGSEEVSSAMTITPTRPAGTTGGPPSPRPSTHWSAGRVIGTVAACLFLLVGALLAVAGAALTAGSSAVRGDDGLYSTEVATWSSPGYAVRSADVDLYGTGLMPGSPGDLMGTVEISATSTAGRDVFVGLASTVDVDRYLAGVARSTVDDPWDAGATRSRDVPGGPPPGLPSEEPIWVASASGPGTQVVSWTPRSGRWSLVVMNADGTAPVSADVVVAAELPLVHVVGVTLLVAGLIIACVAGLGLVLAIPRAPRALPEP